MESDEGKLFIGGIAWDTTEETLRDYFGKYGEVSQTVIMKDKTTGRPRGFAFVVFSDPSVLDLVLQQTHTIDARTVEAKRALSREQQHTSRPGNPNAGRNFGGAGNYRTKKIFVGGLPSTLTEEQFRQYFENYGDVTDVVIMFDQNTNRPRGFGFISFDTEDAVDRVLEKNTFHELNNKLVEVKRALPKDANPGGGGGGGRGGGHQGYGSSGANASTFDGRMDGNRFMQPQATGNGYPQYSSYGPASYGYGAANSNVGYGGYGMVGYGGGTPNTGFGGPARAYGNPNAPNTGYASGPHGALKSTWVSQNPGYGASGYGVSAGYGNSVPWSAQGGSGGAGSAPTGQSPSGAAGAGYGNQGYGYANYGGSEGPYGNSGAYGTVSGRAGSMPNSNAVGVGGGVEQQGIGGGYMGSVYGGNGSSGY